ncbi:response regulator transcription factor [[Clostridium] dakarense]|uniref:response regulator transcription factor n=1 Tax=Faecalimicrobium dakarense TaxID=1301100 RepID=UPI0004AE0ABF|nr:response regulator transcription factor [[Clostridium] dakarense]
MEVLIVSRMFLVIDALETLFSNKIEGYNFRGIKNLREVKDIDLSKVEFMLIHAESDVMDEIALIKNDSNNIKILIFDKNSNKNMILRSMKNGIEGYITDVPEKEELVYIIKTVLKGKKHYDTELLQDVIYSKDEDKLDILTYREKEVLEKVKEGFSNKDIAKKLYITEHTIKKHVTSILSKLNMKNRKDLIIYTKNMNYKIEI